MQSTGRPRILIFYVFVQRLCKLRRVYGVFYKRLWGRLSYNIKYFAKIRPDKRSAHIITHTRHHVRCILTATQDVVGDAVPTDQQELIFVVARPRHMVLHEHLHVIGAFLNVGMAQVGDRRQPVRRIAGQQLRRVPPRDQVVGRIVRKQQFVTHVPAATAGMSEPVLPRQDNAQVQARKALRMLIRDVLGVRIAERPVTTSITITTTSAAGTGPAGAASSRALSPGTTTRGAPSARTF